MDMSTLLFTSHVTFEVLRNGENWTFSGTHFLNFSAWFVMLLKKSMCFTVRSRRASMLHCDHIIGDYGSVIAIDSIHGDIAVCYIRHKRALLQERLTLEPLGTSSRSSFTLS